MGISGKVAICPQFNIHLIGELTVNKYFTFFARISGLPPLIVPDVRQRFVTDLLLDHQAGK
jgi:ABC-type multidrug transport system ATPase subunit